MDSAHDQASSAAVEQRSPNNLEHPFPSTDDIKALIVYCAQIPEELERLGGDNYLGKLAFSTKGRLSFALIHMVHFVFSGRTLKEILDEFCKTEDQKNEFHRLTEDRFRISHSNEKIGPYTFTYRYQEIPVCLFLLSRLQEKIQKDSGFISGFLAKRKNPKENHEEHFDRWKILMEEVGFVPGDAIKKAQDVRIPLPRENNSLAILKYCAQFAERLKKDFSPPAVVSWNITSYLSLESFLKNLGSFLFPKGTYATIASLFLEDKSAIFEKLGLSLEVSWESPENSYGQNFSRRIDFYFIFLSHFQSALKKYEEGSLDDYQHDRLTRHLEDISSKLTTDYMFFEEAYQRVLSQCRNSNPQDSNVVRPLFFSQSLEELMVFPDQEPAKSGREDEQVSGSVSSQDRRDDALSVRPWVSPLSTQHTDLGLFENTPQDLEGTAPPKKTGLRARVMDLNLEDVSPDLRAKAEESLEPEVVNESSSRLKPLAIGVGCGALVGLAVYYAASCSLWMASLAACIGAFLAWLGSSLVFSAQRA